MHSGSQPGAITPQSTPPHVKTDAEIRLRVYVGASALVGAFTLAFSAATFMQKEENTVKKTAQPFLQKQRSNFLELKNLGIMRQGTIFIGVATPSKRDPSKELYDKTLAQFVSPRDPVLGCKIVVLALDKDRSSPLHHFVPPSITVTTFNNAAFANDNYDCHALSLNAPQRLITIPSKHVFAPLGSGIPGLS